MTYGKEIATIYGRVEIKFWHRTTQTEEKMENVFVMEHPLIQHKISQIRDINTGTNEFRKCIEEIAMLMGYEALRDLPLKDRQDRGI